MSELKRYDVCALCAKCYDMEERPAGEWVKADDALAAQDTEAKKGCESCDMLKDQLAALHLVLKDKERDIQRLRVDLKFLFDVMDCHCENCMVCHLRVAYQEELKSC